LGLCVARQGSTAQQHGGGKVKRIA
jgi:hypothetical protein